MYIHILHACLGVYRCRSVGHFHVVGLGCARARLRWVFFLFSPRCSVPWEKKKVLFFDGRCGLLPPPSREQAVAPMQRAPACRQARWARPPLSPTHPTVCPTPILPHTPIGNTRAPDFSRAAGRWGVGACSVGLSGRRPAGAVSRVLMSHSIIYFEKALLFPIACVCVCMCVCMFVCACVCAYLRKGLVNVFSVLGRELQFAPFFLPQCSCRRTLSSWRCFFFSVRLRAATTTPPSPPTFFLHLHFFILFATFKKKNAAADSATSPVCWPQCV